MALYVNVNGKYKRVIAIYKGVKDEFGKIEEKTIASVYQGSKLIWQYIRSCFGRGYWLNDKPWSNTDGWKN